MRYLFLLLCCFQPFFQSKAQLSDTDCIFLQQELTKKVNALRESVGVVPLALNDTLKKAAEMQSIYMVKENKLTHDQKPAGTATPDLRVKKCKGKNFDMVGENILVTAKQEFPLNKKKLSALAEEMFNLWKNSPDHYENMVHKDFTHTGFGFKVMNKEAIIYATQVFGHKGEVIGEQLSKNAFGLKEDPKSCEQMLKIYEHVLTGIGNSFAFEDGKIILYYPNLQLFTEVFKRANDGIAIDLLRRSQFSCGLKNTVDVSPIYDGVLLKPVFRNEILAANTAKGAYHLIAPIGNLPELSADDLYAFSTVLIQNGKKCAYVVPAFIDEKRYDLRPFKPVTENPKGVVLSNEGIIVSEQINYEFKTNITVPEFMPELPDNGLKLHSLSISSYSSVEGESAHNASLHQNRAKSIEKHLQNKYKTKLPIAIDARENWEKMNFQFSYLNRDSLVGKPRDFIKKFIEKDTANFPWDSLFKAQRRSTATLNFYGKLPANASISELGIMNLRTALVNKRFDLAQKALYELYQQKQCDPDLLFNGIVFEGLNEHPQLVQNASALLSLCYQNNLYQCTEFIYNWILRKKELSPAAIINLLHLYSLVGTALLNEWDVAAERLSHVIHPTKVDEMRPETVSNDLLLNLKLTYIEYFGQINDLKQIESAFNFIVSYIKKNNLSPEEEVAVALFFNHWSRFELTSEMLLTKLKTKKLSEDGAFLLAQSLNIADWNENNPNLVAAHDYAAQLNQKRWCSWLNEDFQILRNEQIKTKYCKICE